MKKFSVLTLIILAGVMMVGQTAFAFTLGGYTGPVEFKFFDWTIGRQYNLDTTTGTWVSEGARAGLAGGNQNLVNGAITNADGIADSWGILNVTQITDADGNPVWNSSSTERIHGVIWGFDDTYVSALGTGGQQVLQRSGWIALYLSSVTMDPTQPLPAGLSVSNGFAANPLSSDPWNATNGTPFLVLEAATGVSLIDPLATRDETVNGLTSPFSGNGSGYFDIIGGDYAGLFNSNLYGNGSDTYTIFNFGASGRNSFDAKSSDPAKFTAIPEPTSMLLLGMGLLGLATSRRRKVA